MTLFLNSSYLCYPHSQRQHHRIIVLFIVLVYYYCFYNHQRVMAVVTYGHVEFRNTKIWY